jgi:nitrate/nitrite-specific signal transduction histidine kinase
MGMRIMTYRARMIGGQLVVARGRRGGTAVRCTFPVAAAAVAGVVKDAEVGRRSA